FSSLKCFIVGAAPIAPEKFKEAVRVFGPVMFEGFGQTETLIPILVKRPMDYLKNDGTFDDDAVCAAGKAVGVVRVGIMDPEGRLLPAGERGEIVVRSSMIMQSYYKKPEETAAVYVRRIYRSREAVLTDNRVERRLAAILAADVAGYSRLTGLDEEGTHVRLRERLRGLAD